MKNGTGQRNFLAPLCGLLLAVGLVHVSPLSASSSTEDWHQFRGPERTGALMESGLLDRDAVGLEVAWKRPLGSGYSSIVVSGERGVTMFTDGEHDYATAFDTGTGEELWRYRIAEMYVGHTGSDDGPISTPVIADGVVYGLGPRGQLFAVRLEDGGEVWSRTLDGESDSRAPHYGFATVPIVVDDLLVVQTGGADGHSITAFDRASGEPRWSTGDEPVNYQSPSVLELGGRRQVVAVNDRYLMGLEPSDGEVLWRHEHGTDPVEAFALPLDIGGDRVLVNSLREVVAFQVSAGDGGFGVEELWRSNAFQRSYAIPVLHEGRLYGFSSRFLTCVDAATGEVAWKSRPPGGRGLILVDGKLLIVSPDGELVVAAAAADGYAEEARLPVFDAGSYTVPSIADGHVFVRNLKELAAVRVTDAPTAAMTERKAPERQLLGELGELVRRVESSGDAAPLTEYLGTHDTFPIVEPNGVVHFVYQGEVEDIALTGNFLPFREEVVLDRVAGTDVYFKSLELDPEAVWEYRFSVDFGEPRTDPKNPLTIGSILGEMSELRMPGFEAPDFLGEPEDPRGRVDSFQFRSDIRDNERRVQVYVPAGYEGSEERYPLLFVSYGNQALEAGALDVVLDNLIAKERIAPLIAVIVSPAQGESESEESPAYVRMLTEELVPHLDKHYRTVAEPSSRGLVGVVNTATMALYTALEAPGSFGKLGVQSLFLRPPFSEEVLAAIEESEPGALDVYVELRRHDLFIEGFIDSEASSRQVAEALEKKGFEVRTRDVAGAWGWSSWRAELGHILESFYPAAGGE